MQNVYDQFKANNVHWQRRDNETIVVWTSGYKTSECYDIESFLMKSKCYCISMDFDKQCGKTKAVYKHK